MLPKFNKFGYLPKGIHKARLPEIKRRFGIESGQRKKLFKGLQALIRLLKKQKRHIKSFILNGSFVTAKENPEDFDCILIVKEGFNFDSPEAKKLLKAKKLFDAHLFTFTDLDFARYRNLVSFFGYDRDRKTKGFVEVIL